MKVLYLDCAMGAAGDMLMAALYELLPEKEAFLATMNSLGLPGIEISAEASVKCGITGTHMKVLVRGMEEAPEMHPHPHEHDPHEHAHDYDHHHPHEHAHAHTSLVDICNLISHLPLPQKVLQDAQAVYALIADAEAQVHGKPIDQIHFHEVGTLDALADVVGVCYAINLLSPEKVFASNVHVGSGQVRCAHGLLPVPAPATARLLTGIPIYAGNIRSELCTPTGAALLRHFVDQFGSLPAMRAEKIGYGMGTKDFEAANCVRAMLGQAADSQCEEILELSCNLDDMTPEEIAFASEQLFARGALDVYTTPVGMKKNRPGVLLTCICRQEARDELLKVFFLHTTTLGVREAAFRRYALSRRIREVKTPSGSVHIKESSGFGVQKSKAEYEDLAAIARETGQPLREVLRELQSLDG